MFGELFPKFVECGVKEVFLEKLERSLTSNELKARVPPEVMQSLVEYCCDIGEPEKVERCVLRMDISSLDLNQARLLHVDAFGSRPVPTGYSLVHSTWSIQCSAFYLQQFSSERLHNACQIPHERNSPY